MRELFEETGITVSKDELKLMTTFTNKNYFMDIYLLNKHVDIKDIVLQQDEAVDAKWASEEEIKAMIRSGEFVHSVGIRFEKYHDLCGEV